MEKTIQEQGFFNWFHECLICDILFSHFAKNNSFNAYIVLSQDTIYCLQLYLERHSHDQSKYKP